MKVLFFGDVVGEPGLALLERVLPRLRQAYWPDFVVANGENLDITVPELGRAGIHPESLGRLLALGVDVVTGGNHSFDPPWAEEVLGHSRVLRPLNYSRHAPGKGSLLLRKGEKALLVVNLAGRSALTLGRRMARGLRGLAGCGLGALRVLLTRSSQRCQVLKCCQGCGDRVGRRSLLRWGSC